MRYRTPKWSGEHVEKTRPAIAASADASIESPTSDLSHPSNNQQFDARRQCWSLERDSYASSKTPYLPSIGPAQKWVPRTASAAFGVLTTILFLRIPSMRPPAKRNAPRVALRTTLAELFCGLKT